ncbi:MAG: WD40 repeat domain-containing protein, partial [Mesorhizobium sp.]
MRRSTDRLLALVMLAVGAACFAKLYLALGPGLEGFASLRSELFGAAGLLSVMAGLLFIAGLLPAAARHDPSAPLFGRDAEIAPAGRPRLRGIVLTVPLLAVLAIVADQTGAWFAPSGEPAQSREVAAPAAPATPI